MRTFMITYQLEGGNIEYGKVKANSIKEADELFWEKLNEAPLWYSIREVRV